MLQRFSVSLDEDLLTRFDQFIKEHGYDNRSEAVRDMIRKGGRYGVFGSCCGGGLGVATVIENLQR